MSEAQTTPRYCAYCGKRLVRKMVRRRDRAPEMEALGQWLKRQHCDRTCRWEAHRSTRPPRPLCACGCGRPTTWVRHRWSLYASGCYTSPKQKPRHAPWVDDGSGFWDWLAGFLDGEGFFGFTPRTFRRTYYTPVVRISLRADDGAILEEIARRTGCGRVGGQWPTYKGSQYQRRWAVGNMSDCLRLVEILDAHPLRAKKARDYATWREAVLEKDRNGNTPRLDALVAQLIADRRWASPRAREEG